MCCRKQCSLFTLSLYEKKSEKSVHPHPNHDTYTTCRGDPTSKLIHTSAQH